MFSVICASHFVGDLSQMYLIQLTKARSSGPNLPQSGTQIWQKAFQTRVKDNDKKTVYILFIFIIYSIYTVVNCFGMVFYGFHPKNLL